MDQRGSNAILSVVGLIISVVALLVAIGAYNRTGENFGQIAQETAQRAQESVERNLALIEMQRDLTAIREDILNNNVTEDTRQLIIQVQQEAEDLNLDENVIAQLTQLQTQITNDVSTARVTVENILREIRSSIDTESQ